MGSGYTLRPEEGDLIRRLLGWRPFISGLLASVALAGVYIGVLTLANGFAYALNQYRILWAWMTPLVIGFGFQVGLFIYLKGFISLVQRGALRSAAVWTSTGISTASMIACCVHHVSEVLPIMGLSAAALFVGQYQVLLLALGIVSNAIGIFYMLSVIQKHGDFVAGGKISSIMRWDMKIAFRASIALGSVWLLSLVVMEFL